LNKEDIRHITDVLERSRDIERIANALERIAEALERENK